MYSVYSFILGSFSFDMFFLSEKMFWETCWENWSQLNYVISLSLGQPPSSSCHFRWKLIFYEFQMFFFMIRFGRFHTFDQSYGWQDIYRLRTKRLHFIFRDSVRERCAKKGRGGGVHWVMGGFLSQKLFSETFKEILGQQKCQGWSRLQITFSQNRNVCLPKNKNLNKILQKSNCQVP